MSESRSLELRLESKIDSVDAAELIVMGLAREAGYAEDKIGQLGLAVRESMVNAIAHGNGYSQDKTVHFRVEASSEALTVGIRDEGEGFDPEQAPDPKFLLLGAECGPVTGPAPVRIALPHTNWNL